MPTKNINLSSGTLFIRDPDATEWSTLGEVQEATLEDDEPDAWAEDNPVAIKAAESATFTAEAELNPDIVEAFKAMGAWAASSAETFATMCSLIERAVGIFQEYPDGRVKHLALYHKKERVRKKNMRRIARELKKEEGEHDAF